MNLITFSISMCLSSIIATAGFQWFAITHQHYKLLKRQQAETLKMFSTFHFIGKELQKSGYVMPYNSKPNFSNHVYLENTASNDSILLQEPRFQYPKFDQAVFGFTATLGNCDIKRVPEEICKAIKENSEVLIIYNTAAMSSVPLSRSLSSISFLDFETPEDSSIWKNSLLLISDDTHSDLFVSGSSLSSIISAGSDGFKRLRNCDRMGGKLSKFYQVGAEVRVLQTIVYYMDAKKQGRVLRRDLQRKNSDEILAGLSQIEFQYGLYNPNSASIEYRKADSLSESEWRKVITVRIKVTSNVDNGIWMHEVAIRNK